MNNLSMAQVEELGKLAQKCKLMPPSRLLLSSFSNDDLMEDRRQIFDAYVRVSIAVLEERKSIVLEASTNIIEELLKAKNVNYQRIVIDWYKPGKKLGKYHREVNLIVRLNREHFWLSIQPGISGRIFQYWKQAIQKVETLDAAKRIARELPKDLARQIEREWSRTQERVSKQIGNLQIDSELDVVMPSEAENRVLADPISSAPDINLKVWDKVKSVKYDSAVAASLLFGYFNMALPIVTVTAAVLSVLNNNQEELIRARNELRRAVADGLAEFNGILRLPDVDNLMDSPIERFFNTVSVEVNAELAHTVKHKLIMLKYEIELLNHLTSANHAIRTLLAKGIDEHIASWHRYLP